MTGAQRLPGGDAGRSAHGPARRPAGHHRVAAGRPVGGARDLGRRRLAGRGPRPRRGHALPGAPAVQGHRAAHRAGDLGGDGRGRRRAERVHRQGVHLLLRAGARQRPAAGHRRAVGHGQQLADRAAGRGRRARGDPRRDRHERGRPVGPGPRGVRRAAVRRHPAGPADPRHGRLDQLDQPGPDLRALPGPVHPGQPGRGGGRQPRPRPGRRAGGARPSARCSTGDRRARPRRG